MNKHADARSRNDAAFTVTELNEAELSIVTGGGSSGAGAGKVSFNPFSITRKIDKASPIFFQM